MNASDIKVDFFLNTTGFKAGDLEELMPPFMADYDARAGLQWMPSATGPESWMLTIAAGMFVAEFGKKLTGKVADDVYAWLKEKVGPFMARRANSHGLVTITLDDMTIIVWEDAEFRTVRDLADVLKGIDPTVSKVWNVTVEGGRLTIEPDLPADVRQSGAP